MHFYLCVCEYVSVCAHVCTVNRCPKSVSDPIGGEVTDGCEPPNVGAGNETESSGRSASALQPRHCFLDTVFAMCP